MIPSRGLPPVRRVQFASRHAIRHFSSIPRNHCNGALSARAAPAWRGSPRAVHALNAPAVRNASWYAPWTWAGSSAPAPAPIASSPSPESPAQLAQDLAQEPAAAAHDAVSAEAANAAPAAVPEASGPAASAGDIDALLEQMVAQELASPPVPETGAAAISHMGALKEMGLDFGWGSSAFVEWLMEHMYLDTGLAWGGCILATTVVLRTMIFYFQFKGSDNAARMAAVAPIVADTNEKMKAALLLNDGSARKYRLEQKRIYEAVGASPFRSLAPAAFQAVIGFGAFRCLRNMSLLPVPEMSNGGYLWFVDLTAGDPYFLLPVLSGGIMYLSLKMGGETGAQDAAMPSGTRQVVQTAIPVMMSVISAFQPASIQLYLTGTAVLSAITATTLRNKAFRRATGLAPLPTPEAQAMWKKVANGEIPLDKVITRDGQLRTSEEFATVYLEPRPTGVKLSKSAIAQRRLRAQAGTSVDPTLQDRDHDYDNPPSRLVDKIDWFGRNYNFKFMYRRLKGFISSNPTVQNRVLEQKIKNQKQIAQRQKEEYEAQRRQRFGAK